MVGLLLLGGIALVRTQHLDRWSRSADNNRSTHRVAPVDVHHALPADATTAPVIPAPAPVDAAPVMEEAPAAPRQATPALGLNPPPPQTAAIRKALDDGSTPERFSVMFPPNQPFDVEAFEKNPTPYLETIAPGRVFQTAQPGERVPVLRALGATLLWAHHAQEIPLTVQGAPRAPVTFTALDMGLFTENHMNTVTVQADASGKATVHFVGGDSAVNECHVLAGSPMASERVHFKITIEAPPIRVPRSSAR